MEDGRAIRLWTATGLVINAEVCMLIEFNRGWQVTMMKLMGAQGISEISFSEIYLYCKAGVHSRIQLPIGSLDFRIQLVSSSQSCCIRRPRASNVTPARDFEKRG